MCTTITLDESSILVVLDAIRAKKNEIYDSIEVSKDKDVLKVEEIFSKALETIKAQKVMAMEMKV
jgi:uncharacterized GH25 family protein